MRRRLLPAARSTESARHRVRLPRHRAIGQYPAGSPPYGLDDLVGDSAGLLDVLGIERAHVAGISMGGAIGQRLALDHSSRVASLTLIATSPGMRPGAPLGRGLPPPAPKLRAHFAQPAPEPGWTSRASLIEHVTASQQALVGTVSGGTARFRRIAARAVDRTTDIAASLTNHWPIDPGPPYRPRLSQITASALVIHGTEDPLLPYQHAETLARKITGAQLLPLDRVGHEMPPEQTWHYVMPALLNHTSSDRQR